jgi:hypothetical protein
LTEVVRWGNKVGPCLKEDGRCNSVDCMAIEHQEV